MAHSQARQPGAALASLLRTFLFSGSRRGLERIPRIAQGAILSKMRKSKRLPAI